MTRTILLTLALGLTAACGGDDDGGGTDVNPDKTLDEVTIDEAMAICEYGDDDQSRREDLTRYVCYVEGLAAAENGGDCQAVTDACLEEPVEEQESDCPEITEENLGLPECANMVTVGEYLACDDAFAADIATLADEISCDTSLEDLVNRPQPEECTSLEERCPGIILVL